MKRSILSIGISLAVLAAANTAAFAAPAQDLQHAIDLYNAQHYVQARDLLEQLDTATLTDAQRAIRTDYLGRAQMAAVRQTSSMYHQPLRNPTRQPDRHAYRPVPSFQSTHTLISYPPNWPEIARRHERYGFLTTAEDQPTRLTRQKFDRTVHQFALPPGGTFADAIDRIRNASSLNIVVNWPALEQSGITGDVPVTMPRLTDVTWHKVIDLVLRQVSAATGGVAQLDWEIDRGVLTISTQQDLGTHLTLQVYDVGDLLLPPLVVSPAGQFGTNLGSTATGSSATTGGGTGGVVGNVTGAANGSAPHTVSRRACLVFATRLQKNIIARASQYNGRYPFSVLTDDDRQRPCLKLYGP